MTFFSWVLIAILVLNTIGAVFTVLREVRDIPTTWAWLLVLILLPVLGFGLYLFVGRGLSKKKVAQIKAESSKGLAAFVKIQKRANNRNELLPKAATSPAAKELTNLFLNTAKAPLLSGNQVAILTEGDQKFAQLFADIDAAKSFIYVEYYTIYNDELGNALQRRLVQKAKQGLVVRVLYDGWGSMGASARWWQKLTDAGGQAQTYFSSRYLFLDFRLNYRLHRKIVVIDDHIGYIGGFNVGDQYVSRSKKFGHWRDTHLKIQGPSVQALKMQFLMDWNATVKPNLRLDYNQVSLPKHTETGSGAMQIVASGPDTKGQQIKYGYIKMIASARQSVWLQTPYLIPDDPVMDALIASALAGVDVRIMIPNMPDHPFIFRATQYYAAFMVASGVKVYHYQKGFLHAKTLMLDGKMASVGSANFDIRSFKLNFEANAFIYDAPLAQELAKTFTDDLKDCRQLTPALIQNQGAWLHFKQYFSRLLSPIL